jgi:hypothetical protein
VTQDQQMSAPRLLHGRQVGLYLGSRISQDRQFDRGAHVLYNTFVQERAMNALAALRCGSPVDDSDAEQEE